ncbi:MAG TPA: STAS domain-containing protein, partial [Methanoregula sp.]|nr:STAS domain-containing protein [Methanoregula sp.]
QAINRQIEDQKRQILLNFAGVTYISSGGLRVLLATAKKLKNPGDKFGLCCLAPEVLKILKLAGFTSIFAIYPSEGEALAGW